MRHFTKPKAIVPYSYEDRRMTFAVVPLAGLPGDPQSVEVAKATTELMQRRMDKPIWAHIAEAAEVTKSVSRTTESRELARILNVHFLVRGVMTAEASGYAIKWTVIDGASGRGLGSRTATVPSGRRVPRTVEEANSTALDLLYAGMEAEVQRAADRPMEALDVRDLTWRALYKWDADYSTDPERGHTTAMDLLNRALKLAPDDRLALFATARVNLCDCVLGWSKHPEVQRAMGAAAMDRFLYYEPTNASMLATKAMLDVFENRNEQAVLVADSALRHEPEHSQASVWKAIALVRLGRPDAVQFSDALVERSGGTDLAYVGTAAEAHFAAGDYAAAARLAETVIAGLSELQLKERNNGSIRLTLVAAEAKLGHAERARQVLADFHSSVPTATTISTIRTWLADSATFKHYEPFYEALRFAGIPD